MAKAQCGRRRIAKKPQNPKKRKSKRTIKKKKCLARPRKQCLPLENSSNAFEQFLAEMRLLRKSNMTSTDIRREAEKLWYQLDDDEKQKYFLLAKNVPYVFAPKDKYLCDIICSIRLALKDKHNVNLLELLRAASTMCHWKKSKLKCLHPIYD